MKTLNENNRNPKHGLSYEQLGKVLFDDFGKISSLARVRCGNNTVARWAVTGGRTNPGQIIVKYHDTDVAILYSDSTVRLFDGGFKTKSTLTRHDWVVNPLGYRMTTVRGTWKLYRIATGEYMDYIDGRVVFEDGKYQG